MQFGKLPLDVARRPDLSASAKVVYSMLSACRNTRTGQCNPSQKALQGMTGFSHATVERSIRSLQDAGLIWACAENGRQTSYRIPLFEDTNPPHFEEDTLLKISVDPPQNEGTPSSNLALTLLKSSVALIRTEQTKEQTKEQTAHAENGQTQNRKADPYFEQAVPILESLVGGKLTKDQRGMIGRWRNHFPDEAFCLSVFRQIATSKAKVDDLVPFMGKVLRSEWDKREVERAKPPGPQTLREEMEAKRPGHRIVKEEGEVVVWDDGDIWSTRKPKAAQIHPAAVKG